jgi:4-hydroxybenzoate polyprenyltransferase
MWLAWVYREDALDLTAAIWTLWAGAGVLAMAVLLVRAVQELRRHLKKTRPNKASTSIGMAVVRRDAIRLVKVFALFLIGVMVLTETVNAFVARLLLILVAAGIVLNAFLDLLEREQTDDLLWPPERRMRE